jgi:ribonucleoside-diphosphate reductase alpha chain
LAAERGPFPLWPRGRAAQRGQPPRRNAQLLSIAPTGTISLLAGTSAGIEPLFALAYRRHLLDRSIIEIHPAVERTGRRNGWWSNQVRDHVMRTGSLAGCPAVPAVDRRVLVTALDLSSRWHVAMQAAIQRQVDAAVAKTVNLAAEASVDDVGDLFLMAWRSKVKGITAFRYGSRPDQVLRLLEGDDVAGIVVDGAYAGGCIGASCEW